MSRKDAHAFAASLAATLMVSIVVFQAGDGTFGAVPADEIDGDEVQVLAEYRSVGVMPTVVKKARARRERAVLGLSPVSPQEPDRHKAPTACRHPEIQEMKTRMPAP